MEISEVRIKLVEESRERLRAFCSITLDGDFVIRDLKIIDGVSGPFVAMPSRKLADRCPRCGCKNHLRAKFCNDCGVKLNENRAPKDAMGRAKLHADVAHPINAGCRERIQTAVIKAYEAEVERSKSPDYRPPVYDDFGDDDVTHLVEEEARRTVTRPAPAPTPTAAPEEEPAAEAPAPGRPGGEEGAFSDYNSLIADLKREAAGRHTRSEQAYNPPPAPPATQREPEPRADRGDRGNRREGGRGDRQGGRDDRGRRQDDRRGGQRDERGGGPREDRYGGRRDVPPPPRAEEAAERPAPPPPAEPEQDDFAAGL